MKKYSLFLACLLFSLFTYAQNTMYFMEQMPQTQYLNPAHMPKLDFYLNLPGLNGFSLNAYNSGFNYYELEGFLDRIQYENYDAGEFINSIPENISFQSDAKIDLLSFGFRINEKSFISFNTTMNSTLNLNANSEIAYLLSDYDNIREEKFPLTIAGVDLYTNNYINIGLNYIRKINSRLTIGINPNIINHLAGIKTKDLKYIVEIESRNEYGTKDYYDTFTGEVMLGLPAEINPEIISKGEFDLEENLYADNWENELDISDIFANKNLSLNLGASYELNKWYLSASLLNIGTANWKRKAYQLTGKDDVIHITEEKIKIGIPPKLYIGAARQFSPRWTYGLMLHNTFYPGDMLTSATLSLNGAVGRMLSTSFSYTAGYKFDNLGIGIRLRFFPGMDIFVVTDNLIQAYNFNNAYRISGAAGINFSTGLKKYLKTPKGKLKEASEG